MTAIQTNNYANFKTEIDKKIEKFLKTSVS